MPEIEVSAMTFGPYAVARLDGLTVMVPNAAPGDRLEVSIASRRRDFSIANIDRIITRGPDRRVPPCPFLPRCGGCDWQHLNYAAQLRAKAELIAAGLRRANIDVSARKPHRARAGGIRLSLAHPAEGWARRQTGILSARQQRAGGNRSMPRRGARAAPAACASRRRYGGTSTRLRSSRAASARSSSR